MVTLAFPGESIYDNVIDLAVNLIVQMDMNSLATKRNSDGWVSRDRSPSRAQSQARARRGGRVTISLPINA